MPYPLITLNEPSGKANKQSRWHPLLLKLANKQRILRNLAPFKPEWHPRCILDLHIPGSNHIIAAGWQQDCTLDPHILILGSCIQISAGWQQDYVAWTIIFQYEIIRFWQDVKGTVPWTLIFQDPIRLFRQDGNRTVQWSLI